MTIAPGGRPYKAGIRIHNKVTRNRKTRKIKEIRMKVYPKEVEKNVDIAMLAVAYEEHGLFWVPEDYCETSCDDY